MAVPPAIVVVDLDQPVLMAARVQEIPLRRLRDAISVRPIVRLDGEMVGRAANNMGAGFAENRLARHVQPVERVPNPDDVELRVKNYDHVSDDVDRAWTLD